MKLMEKITQLMAIKADTKMRIRAKIKGFVAVLTCLVMILSGTIVTHAAMQYSVATEYDGLTSDIKENCVQFARYMVPSLPYGLTEKADKVAIINTYTPVIGSIAITHGNNPDGSVDEDSYYGHVAYVESVNGNQITTLNGGFSTGRITRITGTPEEQGVIGYWNPGGGIVTPPVESSLSWSNSDCQPDASNVYVYIEADSNVSGSFTEAGITVWNDNGDVVAQKSENPGVSGKHLNIWYNITEETGVVLQSGTSYKYQFYTVFNGTRYDSSLMSFQTTGQPPVHQEENSWTQELNIENWTYGEDGNTPTATAKYGTVVFSYSTEKEGVYTSEIPQNAGTYYVKATVTETDQYSGLEAVKEFKIEKATPQYTVPAQLSMTYGERLGSIELPDGFSWKDETEASGNVGEKTAYVIYTPEDCNNYHVVNDIPVTITVEPKNLSGMVLDGINSLDDLNRYQMKDGDTVLIKDVDYVIFPYMTQDEKHVLVMVTFLGNYTGTTETTFALDDSDVGENEGNPPVTDDEDTQDKDQSENEDKDQNKDQDEDQQSTAVKTVKSQSPKTGDDSNIFIWGILLLLSGVGASSVIVYGKIQKKTH